MDNMKDDQYDDYSNPSDNNHSSIGFDQSQKTSQPEQRGSNNQFQIQFGFGSYTDRAFNQPTQMGGGGIFQSAEPKKLFTNVEVNLLMPMDPSVINAQFKLTDYIDDHLDKMERLQFFCEIPNYASGEILIQKSIDYFNEELKQKGSPLRFIQDLQHYQMRIAKKKNGKPDSGFPKIDLTQIVADIDFTIFCICYSPTGIINEMTQSIISQKSKSHMNQHQLSVKGKGIMASNNSHSLLTQSVTTMASKNTQHLNTSSNMGASGYDSLLLKPQSSADIGSLRSHSSQYLQTDMTSQAEQKNTIRDAQHHRNTEHQACCNGGCHIF